LELHGDRGGAGEPNHRLVDGKTRVGVNYLYPGLGESQQQVKHDGFGPGSNDDITRVGVDAPHLPAVARYGLPKLGYTGSGPVVGVTLPQGLNAGFDDVLGGFEVGLADLQMDDFLALGFQRPGFSQHLKGGFGAQVHHSAGDGHVVSRFQKMPRFLAMPRVEALFKQHPFMVRHPSLEGHH